MYSLYPMCIHVGSVHVGMYSRSEMLEIRSDGTGSGFWFGAVYVILFDAGTHVLSGTGGAWHETHWVSMYCTVPT